MHRGRLGPLLHEYIGLESSKKAPLLQSMAQQKILYISPECGRSKEESAVVQTG